MATQAQIDEVKAAIAAAKADRDKLSSDIVSASNDATKLTADFQHILDDLALVTVDGSTPPPPPTPPPVTGDVAGFGQAVMPAPPQFAGKTPIFQDRFVTLDQNKWVTYMGASGGKWDNFGKFTARVPGSSGPNTPSANDWEWYSPTMVKASSGLTLTCKRDTTFADMGLEWVGGVITTEGKFALPADRPWYIQAKVKFPDMRYGLWPAFWCMPGPAGSSGYELDVYEGGWLGNPNFSGHSMWWGDQKQAVWDAGLDSTQSFNILGCWFEPNKAMHVFWNGREVFTDTNKIQPAPYEIMLNLAIAGPGTAGWHTVPGNSTPGGDFLVSEVQAYA
jgi:hypothetical protein